jgi:hypothetical protein
MKKRLFILLSLVSIILSYSCEDSLNPYGEFKEKYVLNCVMRADTNFQVSYLTKNYVTPDFNPYSNTNDPTIKNAVIKIWNGEDDVAILRDSTITRQAGDNYKTPYSVYYTNNFQPKPNSKVEIEALLPNGKRLSSSSSVPSPVTFNVIKTDTLIPTPGQNFVRFVWNTNRKDPVFVARLGIYYFKNNSRQTRYIYTIPLSYVNIDGKLTPVNSKPFSTLSYSVDLQTVNTAMKLLSEEVEDKSKIQILVCGIELLSLDDNLSIYYNATARSSDLFSVKLDETDYSNIQGGFGIFGIYIRNFCVIRFSKDYIRSYGFTPALSN